MATSRSRFGSATAAGLGRRGSGRVDRQEQPFCGHAAIARAACAQCVEQCQQLVQRRVAQRGPRHAGAHWKLGVDCKRVVERHQAGGALCSARVPRAAPSSFTSLSKAPHRPDPAPYCCSSGEDTGTGYLLKSSNENQACPAQAIARRRARPCAVDFGQVLLGRRGHSQTLRAATGARCPRDH